jgi:hypothetical protein
MTMGNRVGPGALAGATEAESNIADGHGRCRIRSAAPAQVTSPHTLRPEPPRAAAIVATDWRAAENRGSVSGFVTLRLPSGLVLRDCTFHQQGERQWIGLPGKPQIDAAGLHCIDPTTGKRLYLPIVEIPDRGQRERFQRAALAAVDRLLDQAGDP